MEPRGTFFREVHKNSWLKRLTNDGKRITIGPKKSERTWVVFCVHDDADALLEGYAEPKLAPSHNPEWTLSLQSTQHISHALVHNEKEFEFVITLDSGVVRFHATSWEIMQEWVEVLRQKLREMKILSPRENLYTKLPETRVPLLPTRDPTSPLPATPPVPAAIVPGVECITTISSSTLSLPSLTSVIGNSTNSSSIPSTSNDTVFSTYQSSSSSSSLSSESLSNTGIPNSTSTLNVQTTTAVIHQSPRINEYSSRNTISQESSSSIRNEIKENVLNNNHSELPLRITDAASAATTTPVNSRTNINNPQILNTENSIRVDVIASSNLKSESSNSNLFHYVLQKSAIPTTTATRSDKSSVYKTSQSSSSSSSFSNNSNIVNYQQKQKNDQQINEENNSDSTNIMIIQVSNPPEQSILKNQSHDDRVFKFPSLENLNNVTDDENYKSNVNIIPSCLDDVSNNTQYSSPIKINNNNPEIGGQQQQEQRATTVKVMNTSGDNIDKIHKNLCETSLKVVSQSVKWPEKIILSTNTSGITNITVGNDSPPNSAVKVSTPPPSVHYDKVFLASSSSASLASCNKSIGNTSKCELNIIPQLSSSSPSQSSLISLSSSPLPSKVESKKEIQIIVKNNPIISNKNKNVIRNEVVLPGPSSSSNNITPLKRQNSPLVERKKSKPLEKERENAPPPSLLIMRRAMLTRGATEAVITARPSRIDINSTIASTTTTNTTANVTNPASKTRSESLDRRRRSSSASETDRRQPINNNVFHQNNQNISSQQQQQHHHQIQRLQPFRFVTQDNKSMNISKKLTLREQQVMQLRREIMHPGGVRLQLRKKDCLGSIAWVDIFGTVWVSGWKQKDHPMLYNALHIGDQLISIAGIAIKTAAEANKIIRNSNTLFLEILIRRIPFGRVYAIRREMEGQCLGLIRDGNSATIVDVVPNSLSARHGLAPKAKTCDGLSLTFWVLTEINGRPLNLFSKENEVHDRLNSVGRDISILVQPLDLITKLKKQLKSIRSFKDYIIQ